RGRGRERGRAKIRTRSAPSSSIEKQSLVLLAPRLERCLPLALDLRGRRSRKKRLAELRRARKSIEAALAKSEVLGPESPHRRDDLERGPYRAIRASIRHVDLDSLTRLSLVLREGRREPGLAKEDSGKLERAKLLGEASAVDPRCTDELEGPRRPASFAQIRAFDQHHARVDERDVDRRDIGRWRDPRNAGLLPGHVAAIVLHAHDARRRADLSFTVDEEGELSRRQSVTQRDHVRADERLASRLEDRPLDAIGARRHRTVEHP